MRAKKNSGFTLVEILIVVVILGILAAIVIPQFSNASKEANTSNCQSNLQTLRSQIALFKINNNDNPPVCTTAGFGTSADLKTNTMLPDYLQKIPANPLSATPAEGILMTEGPGRSAAYDSGWWFDTTSEIMHANDSVESYDDF